MGRLVVIIVLAATACDARATSWDAKPDGEIVELQRRRLYLDCLHEYSLGTVVGDDVDFEDPAHRRRVMVACASLAALRLADVVPPESAAALVP